VKHWQGSKRSKHSRRWGRAVCLFPQRATGLSPCPDRSSSICGDNAGRVRYNANPNETPCPCRSSSSRGCSASDGQNCHITRSTRGVPCSPGGHVWSERCLGAKRTGPNSTSVARDPHNHSSLITVAVPFRTSTPRRDGPSRQKGQAATENHGHGEMDGNRICIICSLLLPGRMYPGSGPGPLVVLAEKSTEGVPSVPPLCSDRIWKRQDRLVHDHTDKRKSKLKKGPQKLGTGQWSKNDGWNRAPGPSSSASRPGPATNAGTGYLRCNPSGLACLNN
jgi:hypothetical protein